MQIKILPQEELSAKLSAHYGRANPGADLVTLAEVIRSELLALGTTTRRVLTDRITALLGPVGSVDRDFLLGVIHNMGDLGDLLEGPGGALAPAPLRAVRLEEHHYVLIGTVPTPALQEHLGTRSISLTLPRRVHVEAEAFDRFTSGVQVLEGRILSVERWTGLDRTPPAGEDWLSSLEERLSAQGHEHGAAGLVTWENLERYAPETKKPVQAFRWRKEGSLPKPSLVRARQPGGYRAYAWARPGAPDTPGTLLRLSPDEARRTMFSLDAREGAPFTLDVTRHPDGAELCLNGFLPQAEYRYLVGVSERIDAARLPFRYMLPKGLWQKASQRLKERLQVVIEEKEVTP